MPRKTPFQRVAEALGEMLAEAVRNCEPEGARPRPRRPRVSANPRAAVPDRALVLDRRDRELLRELADAGMRALARKYHPDAGCQDDSLRRLERLRNLLRVASEGG